MSDNIDRLRGTLNFMQSAIKSGEAFTETVAAEWCQANDDLDALSAELSQARREREEAEAGLAAVKDRVRDALGTDRVFRSPLQNDDALELVNVVIEAWEEMHRDATAHEDAVAETRELLRAQDDVIREMTLVLDDLLDRAAATNAPRRTHGNHPGAFALYAETRLKELVGKVAALSSAADTAPAEEQVELRDAWHPTDRELRRGSPSPGGEPDSGGVSMPELGVASTTNLDTCPIVPDDEKCPTCGKLLAFDDGLYYCDHLDAERERRCPDMLKRYRPADTEGGGRAA